MTSKHLFSQSRISYAPASKFCYEKQGYAIKHWSIQTLGWSEFSKLCNTNFGVV